MKVTLSQSLGALAFVVMILNQPPSASGQDPVLNKQTVEETEERFGGIEEVIVVGDADSASETVAFEAPLGVVEALGEAARRTGKNLNANSTALCLERLRSDSRMESDRDVSVSPGTIIIGDLDNPCEIVVVIGQVNVLTTETTIHTQVYRLVAYLGDRGDCAMRITHFSYRSAVGKANLTWESIPESKYTIEWSADLRDWQTLEQDIASQGSSTTHPLKLNEIAQRHGYFRVRLQLASLPTP